jgi:hypothetical protein
LGLGRELPMQDARVNGRVVIAAPEAPDVATCPECGAEVRKRQRRRMDKSVTYFYRHRRGQGKDCPRRYRPT